MNITKKQHIFPVKSIERFCDNSGLVDVCIKGKVFKQNPRNIFYVKREWDQRAESSFALTIENKFQALVEKVIYENGTSISFPGNLTVTRFFALWLYRSEIKDFDCQYGIFSLTPSVISKEEKMMCEKIGVSYIDETWDSPIHFKRGITMFGGVNHFVDRNENLNWKIARISELELVLPDNPGGRYFLPISPNTFLYAGHFDRKLNVDDVIRINLKSIISSNKAYCARSFKKCLFA